MRTIARGRMKYLEYCYQGEDWIDKQPHVELESDWPSEVAGLLYDIEHWTDFGIEFDLTIESIAQIGPEVNQWESSVSGHFVAEIDCELVAVAVEQIASIPKTNIDSMSGLV